MAESGGRGKARLPGSRGPIISGPAGGMAERSKAHAWRACWGQLLAGSNPAPSARPRPAAGGSRGGRIRAAPGGPRRSGRLGVSCSKVPIGKRPIEEERELRSERRCRAITTEPHGRSDTASGAKREFRRCFRSRADGRRRPRRHTVRCPPFGHFRTVLAPAFRSVSSSRGIAAPGPEARVKIAPCLARDNAT